MANKFIGLKEVNGHTSNPSILAMLQLDVSWPQDDEVPWCSAFVNYVCWLLDLSRSKSLRARSWLNVGTEVNLASANKDFDIVVIKRGTSEVTGHVGFFAGSEGDEVWILGGNQGNEVNVSKFRQADILSVRRLELT